MNEALYVAELASASPFILNQPFDGVVVAAEPECNPIICTAALLENMISASNVISTNALAGAVNVIFAYRLVASELQLIAVN
jgi:hypothetical protein